MFGLGMGEIMVILIVALLVLGPTKLPDAAKQIGKAIRELRKHTQNLQDTIEQDEHIGGTVRELKSALRGEPDGSIMPPRPKPAIPALPLEGDGKDEKPVPHAAATEAAVPPAAEKKELATGPETTRSPQNG
jgi:sec-independent protein translocase protein TatB